MAKILVDNDNNIVLQAYTLVATGAAVTDAIASATVYLNDGQYPNPNGPNALTVMPGCSAISMPYYGQTGIYAGLLSGTILLTPGATNFYWIVVTFSNYRFADWFGVAIRNSTTG